MQIERSKTVIIIYRDAIGSIARQVDEQYGISFCEGNCYFTDTKDVDYCIPVEDVMEIKKGEL
jgi:hypothetical protein